RSVLVADYNASYCAAGGHNRRVPKQDHPAADKWHREGCRGTLVRVGCDGVASGERRNANKFYDGSLSGLECSCTTAEITRHARTVRAGRDGVGRVSGSAGPGTHI